MSLLDYLDTTGALSKTQRERYYHRIVGDIGIHLRRRIRQGEPLLVTVSYVGHSPYSRMFVKGTRVTLAANHQLVSSNPRRFIYLHGDDGSSGESVFRLELEGPPGRRQVELAAEVGMFRSPRDEHPLWQRRVDVSETVEVVPAQAADVVTMVADDAMGQWLKRTITAHYEPKLDGCVELTFELSARARISFAFQVIARDGQRENSVGYWYCWKGARDGVSSVCVPLEQARMDDLVIMLRSSGAVAQMTVELEEIWDGELVVEPKGGIYE